MKIIANLIKRKLPNYDYFVSCAFDVPYNHQWNNSKYVKWSSKQGCYFTSLKNNYSTLPLTRTMIIDLFKYGKYYDGFLCAMVWGNIGANRNGKQIFQHVFDVKNRNAIISTIQRVIQLLQQNNLAGAYSLLHNGASKIAGIGESFFTKLLYFAGANISNLTPQSLIFDNNMRMTYYKMMCILNAPVHSNSIRRYIDYCVKMEQLSKFLNLQTVGHLEALLYCPGIRESVF